jgi:site-specific DNA-methyltransferase (adenine-specific)/modification methylase
LIDTFSNIDAIEFLKAIPDQSVDLVFTDPPYNVSHHNKIFRDYRSGRDGTINYDYGEWDYDYDPIPFLTESKRILVDGGSLIIWTSEQLYGTYRNWAEDEPGMLAKQMLIWEKTNPVPNFRKVSRRQATELMIWISKGPISKKNPNFIFTTQEASKNIMKAPICGGNERVKRPDTGKSHPNQKPLAICRSIIQMHCRIDGLIVDPYCGVGSIPVAAKLENRHFLANDLDSVYLELAKQRISALN